MFVRTLFARLALGVCGGVLASCGGGDALAPGAVPNNSGGGSVPVAPQAPPGTTIPGVLIDGGVAGAASSYSGVDTTATDVQSALDAGTDPKTAGSGTVPVDPAGSHAITFSGSGVAQVIFQYGGALPALYYSGTTSGQFTPLDYGAIVLYAGVTSAAVAPAAGTPRVALELTGGANATAYDVRTTCGALAARGAAPSAPLARYVCALPPYGATAGTSGSATLVAGTTSSYVVDNDIANPRIAGTSGSFTPASGARLYVELIYASSTTSASTGNTLALDYLYAEAGTK